MECPAPSTTPSCRSKPSAHEASNYPPCSTTSISTPTKSSPKTPKASSAATSAATSPPPASPLFQAFNNSRRSTMMNYGGHEIELCGYGYIILYIFSLSFHQNKEQYLPRGMVCHNDGQKHHNIRQFQALSYL